MYRIFLAFMVLLCSVQSFAKGADSEFGVLKKDNEKLLFAFDIKENGKKVFIGADADGKYIVYRSGTKNKVELQYPEALNELSWNKFKYSSYHKNGGAKNDTVGDSYLSFNNKMIQYEVYENWHYEDGLSQGELRKEVGLILLVHGRVINEKAVQASKAGSLVYLPDEYKRYLVNEDDK